MQDGTSGHEEDEERATSTEHDGCVGRTCTKLGSSFALFTDPYAADFDKLLRRTDTLKRLKLDIHVGELVVVVGAVGSGKTTLVSALTEGEVQVQDGGVAVRRSDSGAPAAVAFASQEPWLQSGTVRSNILFARPYKEAAYRRAIEACELAEDLKQLAKGDETKIGEHGVRLSGGQRARVALARCIYGVVEHTDNSASTSGASTSTSGTFVFDDVLSALDAQVSRSIFEGVLVGLLEGHTRILVTHDPRWVQHAAVDRVVYLKDGAVAFDGGGQEMAVMLEKAKRKAEAKAVEKAREKAEAKAKNEVGDEEGKGGKRRKGRGTGDAAAAAAAAAADDDDDDDDDDHDGFDLLQAMGLAVSLSGAADGDGSGNNGGIDEGKEEQQEEEEEAVEEMDDEKIGGGKKDGGAKKEDEEEEEEEETKRIGSVGGSVYAQYLSRFASPLGLVMWLLTVVASVLINIAFNAWLAVWVAGDEGVGLGIHMTRHVVHRNVTTVVGNTTVVTAVVETDDQYYIAVYAVLTVAVIVVGTLRWSVYAFCGFRAARSLHRSMLQSVLRVPMTFFWRTPSGRIINRFASDVGQIDDSVPWTFGWFIWCLNTFLQSFIVCVVSTPRFLFLATPVMIIYLGLGTYYRYAERDCKRLVQVVQSPLYSHTPPSLTHSTSPLAGGAIAVVLTLLGVSCGCVDHPLLRYRHSSGLRTRVQEASPPPQSRILPHGLSHAVRCNVHGFPR
jgi:ABC-type multidrug transport system fused ATPase/permease subunit